MTITRKIAAVTAVAVLAATGLATAADVPVVSPQKTSASRYAPVVIPGTGIKKGERLPRGAKIVYRDITILPGQEKTFVLRAPQGKTMRALAERNHRHVGFRVNNRHSYVGRKHISLTVWGERDMPGEQHERVYALVR